MTVYCSHCGGDLPTKVVAVSGHRRAEARRHILNKKIVGLWMLITCFPCVLLVRVFSDTSPFFGFSSAEKPSELVEKLKFMAPEFSRSCQMETALPPEPRPSSLNHFNLSIDELTGYHQNPPPSVNPKLISNVNENPPSPSTENRSPPREDQISPLPTRLGANQNPPPSENSKSVSSVNEKPPSPSTENGSSPPSVDKNSSLPPGKDLRPPSQNPSPKEDQTPILEKKKNPSRGDRNRTSSEDQTSSSREEPSSDEQTLSSKEDQKQLTSGGQSLETHVADTSEECNLNDGEWVDDPLGPLYTNETCSRMQSHHNCMRNGRPDTGYLYYRWKPRQCELPRFDAKAFLQKFWGKSIGFLGDSMSRNQMDSLLCLLWQVEVPERIYESYFEKNVRWLFKEHQFVLGSVWSPYLIRETKEELEAFPDLPKGKSKLFLDTLDHTWTSVMNDFDILVFFTSHWFFQSCVYIEKNEIIGSLDSPELKFPDIGYFQAYKKVIHGVLQKVSRDFKGLAVLGTFTMDHFENGSWHTQGTCKREKPMTAEENPLKGNTALMHQIVVDEYYKVVENNKNVTTKGKLELLDVTYLSLLRADGHPGPWRSVNPYEGKPPGTFLQNDCLHWCLPGPVDTWNQFLLKIVSPHLEGPGILAVDNSLMHSRSKVSE